MKYKSVIFDLDGTLLDTIYDLAASAEYMCRKYGDYSVSIDLAKKCVGNGLKVFLSRIYDEKGIVPTDFESDAALLKQYYFTHATENTGFTEGAAELLSYFRKRNIPIILATMKPFSATLELLKYFDIIDYFEMILCGDTIPEPKPSRKIVDLIINKLRICEDEVLIIGDGMTDVRLADNSGCRAAALLNGYGNHDDLIKSNAKYKVNSLSELLNILKNEE